jgi:hypothetical protein
MVAAKPLTPEQNAANLAAVRAAQSNKPVASPVAPAVNPVDYAPLHCPRCQAVMVPIAADYPPNTPLPPRWRCPKDGATSNWGAPGFHLPADR